MDKETPPTDKELLDYLDSQSNGQGWIARQSTRGLGYRVHNDTGADLPLTVREAILKAMKANNECR